MKTKRQTLNCYMLLTIPALFAAVAFADGVTSATPPGYTNTPFLPSGKWRVHDAMRPHPQVIKPAGLQLPVTPPSDAIVLFDGKDLSKWAGDAVNPPPWKVENGYMEVAGKGGIHTTAKFGDIQLHLEWCEPPPRGDSQKRGNSGVFLMGMYEIQVLDCFNNETYADGQTGSVYGQTPPLVNACLPAGEWQAYDILWTAPRFSADGKLDQPAYVTVIQNGIVVQNHTALIGRTQHQKVGTYSPHEPTAPLALQNHGDAVRFRNVWVRPIQETEKP